MFKNIASIAGYIPIIGTIVGIAKLVFIFTIQRELEGDVMWKRFKALTADYFAGQKIRSVIEAASLGILLLISELIFTTGRNITSSQSVL